MWMTLVYIVAFAVVAVIVAIAMFYVVVFLTFAFRIERKLDGEEDRKRKRQKSIDKEEDRVTKRKRKNRFWDVLYRDREPPPAPVEPPAIEQQQKRIKRIAMKRETPPDSTPK
jgi:flagellar biosynthesis/type III secretory pathway M-ring protein FliF/YscJ